MSTGPAQSSFGQGRWRIVAALAVGFFLPTVWKVVKGSRRREEDRESLNPVTFTPYTLVSKEAVSSSSAIFTLRLDRPSSPPSASQLFLDKERAWPRRAIWSVQIKQPQLQIGRSYTPLPLAPRSTVSSAGSVTQDDHVNLTEIRLLVRREQQGEVSNYLHGLPVGSTVELRGPHIEYEIPDDVDRIVFLAGGTGIAPALQAAHSLLMDHGINNPEDRLKIHILWANRRREDCIGGSNSNDAVVRGRAWDDSWGLKTKLASMFWRTSHPPSQTPSSLPTSAPDVTSSSQATVSRIGEQVVPSPIAAQFNTTETIVDHLKSLCSLHAGRVTVDYFVDEENTFITRNALSHYISRDPMASTPSSKELTVLPSGTNSSRMKKGLILVSGPDGFVSAYAGPKKMTPVPMPVQSNGLSSTQMKGLGQAETVGGVLAGLSLPLVSTQTQGQEVPRARSDAADPVEGRDRRRWIVRKL